MTNTDFEPEARTSELGDAPPPAAASVTNLPARRDPKPPLMAGHRIAPIVPQSVEEVWRLAEVTYRSNLAPKDLNTPEKIAICIMTGLELDLPPMMSMQSIAVINGKPCIYGDAMPGLAYSSGICLYIKEWQTGEPESDEWTFHCETQRRGFPKTVAEFSVKDAKRARLWGKVSARTGEPTPWVTFPQRMLKARARSFCLRDAYPDVYRGLPTREEMLDTIDGAEEHVDTVEPVNALAAKEARPEPRKRTTKKKNGHDPEAVASVEEKIAAQTDKVVKELETLGHVHTSTEEATEDRRDVPGPKAGEQTQYMRPAEQTGEETIEDVPFDEAETETAASDLGDEAAAEPRPPTVLEKFVDALATCATQDEIKAVGLAYRDIRQKLLPPASDDPTDNEMANEMLKAYQRRQEEMASELRAKTSEARGAEPPPKAAAPKAQETAQEATDARPTTQVASPATSAPTSSTEAPGGDATNPGWPKEVEDKLVEVGTPDCRSMGLLLWEAKSVDEVETLYMQILQTPRYQALQTSKERMAISKVRSFAAMRFT